MCPVAGDTTELQSQFLQLHLGGTRSAMDRTAFCVFWAYLLVAEFGFHYQCS